MSFNVVRQQGFTLLELLVVVAIMAALSVSLVDIVQYQDDQQRFELTRTRLETLRFAIFGDHYLEPSVQYAGIHNRAQIGYLVDNGRLPGDLSSLLTKPANHSDYDRLEPTFDQSPYVDDNCSDLDQVNNVIGRVDDEAVTDDLRVIRFANTFPVERLSKGYRNSYLPLQAGSDDFLDGWGNAFDLNVEDNTLIESFGSDGLMGESVVAENEPNYSTDTSLRVGDADWRQGFDGWRVSVTFPVDADGNAGPLHYGISVLLFENADADGLLNWRRISTTTHEHELSTENEYDFDFLASTTESDGNYNFACRTWLPPGRHLLVIFSDEGGDPHVGNDEIPLMAAPFTILPRGGALPNLVLEYERNIQGDVLPD